MFSSVKPMRWIVILGIGFFMADSSAHAQDSKRDVLQVAQAFMDAIGQGDTTAFRSLFLPGAMIYICLLYTSFRC